MKTLGTKTINGISWNTLATISNAFLQIVYTAFMARILDPSAFGLLAMAAITLKFGNQFSKMGMAQALIQKQYLTNVDVRSAFTFSTILGLFFSLTLFLIAPLFEYVFNTNEIVPLIQLMSISYIINGLSVTSLSLLGKNLEFKKLALIDISSYLICNMGIGISLAIYGFGVYSLILASIFQQVFFLVLAYYFIRHSIIPLFSWKIYKPLLSYGSKISLIGFIEYISSQLDTFLIARFFGALKTGLYSRARIIVLLPTYNLTVGMSRVIFPAFSKLQSNKKKLRNGYFSSIIVISAFLFPICFGIFAASKEIILVLLGDQWIGAIPLLAILTFAAPLKLLSHFAGILCDATANLNKKLLLQIVYLLALSVLFFSFKSYGLIAFPIIIVIAEIFKNTAFIIITKNILNVSFLEVLKAYVPGILIGIIVFVGIQSLTVLLNYYEIGLVFKFSIQVFIGFALLLTFGLIYPIGQLKNVLIERSSNLPPIKFRGNNLLLYLSWYREINSVNQIDK